jgi:hypothetical protein
MSDAREAQALLGEALLREGGAQRLLLAGESDAGEAMREVAELYRRSWEAAPPRSYGRLVGMLKASVLSGDATLARDSAAYARGQIEREGDSPASCYAVALAALIEGDAAAAARAAEGMRSGSAAFGRTSEAIEALALGEEDRFRRALEEIVADFASRDEHLTGVPIADTALVLERVSALGG